MKHCGMDVHLRSTTAEIVDTETGVVESFTISTKRDAFTRSFGGKERMSVVLEASTTSHWVADVIENLGHTVTVVDPNRTSAIAVSGGFKKTDALDASTLAWLSSKGAVVPTFRASREMRERRRALTARLRLVRSRGDLVRTVRSILTAQGLVAARRKKSGFAAAVRETAGLDTKPLEPLLSMVDQFDAHIAEANRELAAEAGRDPIVRRLMTADGIGPVTATLFRTVIEDPRRFTSARQVAAYVGLVPGVYNSGSAKNRLGSITKRGDKLLRANLVEAAHALLHRCRHESALRTWGCNVQRRVGTKKAAVAVARKLCTVMWSMWRNEEDFCRRP